MSEETNLEEELLPVEDIQYEEEAGLDISTTENYDAIKDDTILVNPETGEVVDVRTLPPFERIKFVSNRSGKTINDPDKNCKHCYGRGYTAIDVQDGIPTPCKCIFKDFYAANPHYKNVEFPSYNRQMRRHIDKTSRKKPVANPALEKRQKRMNDLMMANIKNMLANDIGESAEIETTVQEEVLPFTGVESAEFTPTVSEE